MKKIDLQLFSLIRNLKHMNFFNPISFKNLDRLPLLLLMKSNRKTEITESTYQLNRKRLLYRLMISQGVLILN